MFVPVWAWKAAPYVAGVTLAVAAYVWAYDNGRDAERAIWKQKEAKAAAAARAREDALQAQVDAAGVALSMSTAEIQRLSNAARANVRNYYVTNPASNVRCLADDRLLGIQASDAAAQTAVTAK
jgi:hypothetical protein